MLLLSELSYRAGELIYRTLWGLGSWRTFNRAVGLFNAGIIRGGRIRLETLGLAVDGAAEKKKKIFCSLCLGKVAVDILAIFTSELGSPHLLPRKHVLFLEKSRV